MKDRVLKKQLAELLRDQHFSEARDLIAQGSFLTVVHPLLSFLCHTDQWVRWGAISLLGRVVAYLADEDMETARVIMRRLMWSLNDESGGIGWGAPEAMGEIMSCHEALAGEYGHIMVAYMREDGSYLELEPLQRGLMWGLGRLAEKRPALLADLKAGRYLLPYLSSQDPAVRGLAARALGFLHSVGAVEALKTLLDDQHQIDLYQHFTFSRPRVAHLAQQALDEIDA